MNLQQLRVLVVGCGNIAGGFDAERPASAPPLTHAGAYWRHGGFRLVACVEPDAARREAFMQRWLVEKGYATIDAAAAAGPYDVVSLCSPTALHAAHIAAILSLHPRSLFCEKPVTRSAAETAAAVEVCAAAGVKMAVNHNRRWAPDIVRLQRELRAGAAGQGGPWGAVRSAIGIYNKGILNNGSHLVDLVQMLLGPLELIAAGAPVFDHWPDDPTVPALLQTRAGVPVTLNAAHAADYAIFELQLLTERGMIAMEDGGAGWRVRRIVGSPHFKGYAVLDGGQRTSGEYHASTLAAVGNLHDALTREMPLASTGETALAAQRLCELIGSRSLSRAERAGRGAETDFATSTAQATLAGAFASTRSPATLPTLTEVQAVAPSADGRGPKDLVRAA
ncbi:MAG: Gfo/Idh/MocA family oxidoreductase [Burkholderiales bacterium]|nr:Gfo/Idh/MocA family oxidoreductase [Burkholderiales bacterium]